jgi:MFS family permease
MSVSVVLEPSDVLPRAGRDAGRDAVVDLRRTERRERGDRRRRNERSDGIERRTAERRRCERRTSDLTSTDPSSTDPSSTDPSSGGTFRSTLAHRRFRWLIAGHAASSIGQTLGTVAVAGVLYARTGQIAWVTAAAAARLLPYVLGSAPAGVLADRCDRRQVLLWSCVLRSVLVAGLAGGVVAAAPPALLVALVFAATLAGTPCYPALAAAIPEVVPRGDLAPANGLLTTIETGAFMIGPALGGLLLFAGSASLVLVVNALAFAVALALFLPVGVLSGVRAAEAPESFGGALVAGLRTIAGSGQVLAPMVLVVTVNLVYGGSLVCLAAYARVRLGTGESGLGVLTAALGVGALAGVFLANPLARARRPMRAILVSAMLAGLPFAVLAVIGHTAVAAVLLVGAGAASIVTEVLAVTLLQRSVPATVVARVFGVLDSLVLGAVLVGAAVMHPMIQVFGLEAAVVVMGVFLPVTLGAVAWGLHHPESGLRPVLSTD